ncbi:MAG: flagellar motor switch phosphatase FliY [Lachnospiraceae bacterium]|nr:flagellar motor switch phosphatase FliY [Lachnospiraceae bacterium]MDD7664753.1 flagellar motor switch phosphatase FliY [Lachnospiraceae bacterium]MDY4164931.1 flagellar motor switch phosphatase FliY [Lachnospiraceae bacterium]
MGDTTISQDEIDALLKASNSGGGTAAPAADGGEDLTDEEKDTIGEVANISMGTAATTLFSLVNKKVEISTPVVSLARWDDIVNMYERPCVMVKISYTKGLNGSNILILKENDVKIITDLMMGGDGSNVDGEITELHLSAISEAMNQMMGSASTALSSMLNMVVDISPPQSDLIDLQEQVNGGEIDAFLNGTFVLIDFKMLIGDLVDSKMMQLYPISLAKEMCSLVANNMQEDSNATTEDLNYNPSAAPQPQQSQPQPVQQAPANNGVPYMQNPGSMPPPPSQPVVNSTVDVQGAQFTPFVSNITPQLANENIDLIMDVPLEVTVELGRTHKSIHDILEFAPGTIIELNKIAGEPVDVLVNGKYVAKGEVVVIEESFGVRITEIVK